MRGISSTSDISLTDDSIFIQPKAIFLGGSTTATINRMLSEGDIFKRSYYSFHAEAHLFFKDALQYIQKNCPSKYEVIYNSVWVEVEKGDKTTWSNIEFILLKYSNEKCMEEVDNDKVYEKFMHYRF